MQTDELRVQCTYIVAKILPIAHTGGPAAEDCTLTVGSCHVGFSRYEDVYEIPLWEDQPASPSSLPR